MVKGRTIPAGSLERPWTCSVSASPAQVEGGDDVKFTVALSNPGILRIFGTDDASIDAIPGLTAAQIDAFYGLFNYAYDPGGSQLRIPSSNPATVANQQAPVGLHHINVTVTADASRRQDFLDWFAHNAGLVSDADLSHWESLESVLFTTLTTLSGIVSSQPASLTVVNSSTENQFKVRLQRSFVPPTSDRALWAAIRNRTAAIGFERYERFINCVLCHPLKDSLKDINNLAGHLQVDRCLDSVDPKDPTDRRQASIYGPYAYSVLKLATQVFLTLESGLVLRQGDPQFPKIFDIEKESIRLDDSSLSFDRLKRDLQAYIPLGDNLPYLDRIVKNLITLDAQNVDEVLPYCLGVLQHRLTSPSLIELIWSYWLEEGMLVQTMNAIARRFQNRRGSPYDPLGELEFDPLRPLNNLIWGFIQDEHNRLTVSRRAHEYIHHYGLSLVGKAVPDLNPADTRSKFIEAFHNLLSAAARFFREDSDTTVIADSFPLLNALKDVHLILAEGAHNQFGDLTWTARAETMTIQWMLARPEMKEFLRGRYMVPYQERWMGAVDSMKKLQGWTDTTITHFYELAVTGERILLSIRYGDWSDIENIQEQAANWARSCKPEIQRYIYAYQTVAGVDLSSDVVDSRDAATRYLQPSTHLQRRLAEQMSAMRPRGPSAPDLVAARVSGGAQLARPVRPRLPTFRKES
jgi:hypothetical protein